MMLAVRNSVTAFSNWILVIWALLPQILARVSLGSKAMFVIYLLEPIIIVTGIYVVRAFLRLAQPNYGTSLFLFYASGLLPYYLFLRVSSRTRAAVTGPNSFLPGATSLDVYIGTTLVEVILNLATTVLVFYGLWLYGVADARPDSIWVCAQPYLLLTLLGMGVGMINNVILGFLRFWYLLYRVSTRGLIFLSGIFVVIDATPPWLRQIMIANPLTHGVDWFRMGVYGRYPDSFVDKGYLIEWTLVVLFIGFVVDRAALRLDRD